MRMLGVIAILTMSCTAGWAQAPAQVRVSYSSHPDGKGDPGAITCRRGQELPRSRLLGPTVCRTNAVWAQLVKDGMDLSPDGTSLVPSEKYRTLNPGPCGPTAPSAGTTSAMMASRGGMSC